MISVNLFGQPGAGKSSTALMVAAYFKNRGKNIELITEYVKQMVYANRKWEIDDQLYILAKQHKKMNDIKKYEKIPIVVTDCPLLLGLIYCEGLDYYEELANMTKKLHNKFDNINVRVLRTKPYNPVGRFQTEEESDALGVKVDKILGNIVKFDYTINGDEDGQLAFAKLLHEKLKI